MRESVWSVFGSWALRLRRSSGLGAAGRVFFATVRFIRHERDFLISFSTPDPVHLRGCDRKKQRYGLYHIKKNNQRRLFVLSFPEQLTCRWRTCSGTTYIRSHIPRVEAGQSTLRDVTQSIRLRLTFLYIVVKHISK